MGSCLFPKSDYTSVMKKTKPTAETEDFVLATCEHCGHEIMDSAVAQYKETVTHVYNGPVSICLCNKCAETYLKEGKI